MVEETSIELGDPISMSESPTVSAVTDLQIETPEERLIFFCPKLINKQTVVC